MMRRTAKVLIAAAALACPLAAASGPLSDLAYFGYQPKASSGAMVTQSGVRITVLTPMLLRIEQSSSNTFEDRATLAFLNRNLPVPQFTQNILGTTFTLQTSALTLTFDTSNPLSTLKIVNNAPQGGFTYNFGQDGTKQNLRGTIKSLDILCTMTLNCNNNADVLVHDESLHCTWGAVSQGGWVMYNDTANYIMDKEQWFSRRLRAVSDYDGYFFGHGLNYKQALQDFVAVGGKQPIPSRPLLGSWYTRWYDYDATDIKRLVGQYEATKLPLDVMVLDMNWHTKEQWTGWSWDEQLHPYPNATIAYLHQQGLMTACNIHDDQGVLPYETQYAALANAMGIDPASNTPIEFAPLNGTYMRGLADNVMKQTGFDFYWTDWQQGGWIGDCDGGQLNPTFITDHVRATDNMRRGLSQRSNNFARWGGLGSHRYPVGFSGDVLALTWECFAYQPYMSATAANVGYGYISHDLVGPVSDHELHVRWMQFGAFSGVMRLHDRGMSTGLCWPNCAIGEPWLLPYEYLDAVRNVMTQRVALLPYTYTEARRGYDTGLSYVHPLYYEWPEQGQAYGVLLEAQSGAQQQYMFGQDLMVNAIVQAADASTGFVTSTVWVPPGTWYDDVYGVLVSGPKSITRQYALADMPLFYRAGAIVPTLPVEVAVKVGAASQQYTAVDWTVYPGGSNSTYTLYEDDGASYDYITKNAASWQTVSYSMQGRSMSMTIAAATGDASVRPAQRTTRVVVVGQAPLVSGTCNGNALSYSDSGAVNTWSYDASRVVATIVCGALPTGTANTITATFAAPHTEAGLHGARGIALRAFQAKHHMDNRQETPGEHSSHVPVPGYTKRTASHAARLNYLAATGDSGAFLAAAGTTYTTLASNAVNEMNTYSGSALYEPAQMTSLMQFYSTDRHDMMLCSSVDCMLTNPDYAALWVEGYQPTASGTPSQTLYGYWNANTNDNWADVFSTAPNGYTGDSFTEGSVIPASASVPNTACLNVYVSGNDHFTFASSASQQYAAANGYTQVESCIARVLLQSDAQEVSARGGAKAPKKCWAHAAFERLQQRGSKSITARDILIEARHPAAAKLQSATKKAVAPISAKRNTNRIVMISSRKQQQQPQKGQKQQQHELGSDYNFAANILSSALSAL